MTLNTSQEDSLIMALPKADLHIHQEAKARLGVIAARRLGVAPVDRRSWARHVLASTPPGMGRLDAVYEPDAMLDLSGTPDDDQNFVTRVADLLEEGAQDGAILI